MIDIFGRAGLQTPDVSISPTISRRCARDAAQNLALEMLRKLLNDAIKSRARKNAVQARSLRPCLTTIRRYQNRTIDAAEVILGDQLLKCARPVAAARTWG